ncbi:hypothetical protein PFAG_02704 [Plasmodium falciparum Santa Lucia]|uniref:Uncharacterized protein n=6 Tax=Plasmodium falciparum TaxID=5833 RepID=A0A024W745_PLAFA|nr:hypothetical protein PFTANZ_02775 [Plasmodium falciparum Tanzania (2000708)]ETW46155.1 hypothetical protein PFMALIP_05779 [Plasmodium falciparum MaliPS096_E11]ETW61276.1 hypothetical protein PFMC_02696 [Plasmodium falciparum CAMP/Malaysia]EUR72017.1 hypothetical protein PFBG_02796 [Plasmodium falciparum 7G8]EUT85670.1 hypothetical protein PFAG_02704 [Plasmodium falciparum Santa Lucia]EWC76501.1 hypothetical protein C923_02814 [Plasmodium falciparum UGT5.1]
MNVLEVYEHENIIPFMFKEPIYDNINVLRKLNIYVRKKNKIKYKKLNDILNNYINHTHILFLE